MAKQAHGGGDAQRARRARRTRVRTRSNRRAAARRASRGTATAARVRRSVGVAAALPVRARREPERGRERRPDAHAVADDGRDARERRSSRRRASGTRPAGTAACPRAARRAPAHGRAASSRAVVSARTEALDRAAPALTVAARAGSRSSRAMRPPTAATMPRTRSCASSSVHERDSPTPG